MHRKVCAFQPGEARGVRAAALAEAAEEAAGREAPGSRVDEFKKTWLTLKAQHEQELRRLRAKLARLRHAGSAEPSEESKTCHRCLVTETYKEMLQQDFTETQQRTLEQIADLTAEKKRLEKENQRLSAQIQARQPQLRDYSVPTIHEKRIFPVKDPSRYVEKPPAGRMTAGFSVEQSPNVPEMPSFEDPTRRGTIYQKASATSGPPEKGDSQGVSNLPVVQDLARKFTKRKLFTPSQFCASTELPEVVSETSQESTPAHGCKKLRPWEKCD